MSKEMNAAVLILENGERISGRAFGRNAESSGHLIFYNGSANLHEVITDPACAGKIVVLTNPSAGNYGINLEDIESEEIYLKGLIVREMCDRPSSWRCEIELGAFFRQHKALGMEGADTRALAKYIAKNGSVKGIITFEDKLTGKQISERFAEIDEQNLTKHVTCSEKYSIPGGGANIAVIDLGRRSGLIKRLAGIGANITIFPAFAGYAEIAAANPRVILLTGGPGSPPELAEIADTVKQFFGIVPVFAVGMGCTVLGMALGAVPKKLPYGHYSASVTVKAASGELYVTAQSHEYTLENLPQNVTAEFINVSDKSIEGISQTVDNRLIAYGVMFNPDTLQTSFKRSTGFFFDFLVAVANNKETLRTKI